jgi:hypothetical protein
MMKDQFFLRNGIRLSKVHLRRNAVITITVNKDKPTVVVETNSGFKIGPFRRLKQDRFEVTLTDPLKEIVVNKGKNEMIFITTKEVDPKLLQRDKENEEWLKAHCDKKGRIKL